ncbi:hypothetical protein ACG04Q_01010 [Roseateles sp. DXS20W]|uniref:Uncharacterized protein n=1 Tax=Pelomonas lactea TaxID=3299030 RepID=A0ABW7GDU8_9BURK
MTAGFLARRALATQGNYRLPPFGALQIRAVERALRLAWQELRASPAVYGVQLATANEVAISEGLLRVVDLLRNQGSIRAFTKDFETPHSDGGLSNYNGQKLAKRPDLSFKLKVNPAPGIHGIQHRLFVEAKVLNGGKQTVGKYCSDGLSRYVVGDYAWGMPHAFMLAYVKKPTFTLPASLDTHLAKNGGAYNVKGAKAVKCTYTTVKPDAFHTTHGRTWTFKDGTSPGDIQLIHLWLNV